MALPVARTRPKAKLPRWFRQRLPTANGLARPSAMAHAPCYAELCHGPLAHALYRICIIRLCVVNFACIPIYRYSYTRPGQAGKVPPRRVATFFLTEHEACIAIAIHATRRESDMMMKRHPLSTPCNAVHTFQLPTSITRSTPNFSCV